MNFFYDSEFIEGFLPNRLFGLPLPNWISKRRHAIDLISISILSEDGDTYNAISSEYRWDDASDWVKENVILPLYTSTVHGDMRNSVDEYNFHRAYGKSNKLIAEEIKSFVYGKFNTSPIEFYGYYSAYDHVLLSSLFGTMLDLPDRFPMYTIDLKQTLNENVNSIFTSLTAGMASNHKDSLSRNQLLTYIKSSTSYPQLAGEHLSKNDAQWNKQLFDFLEKHS